MTVGLFLPVTVAKWMARHQHQAVQQRHTVRTTRYGNDAGTRHHCVPLKEVANLLRQK